MDEARVQVVARTLLGATEHLQETAAVFRFGDRVPITTGAHLHETIIRDTTIRDTIIRDTIIHQALATEPGVALVVVKGYGGASTGDIACELALEGLGRTFRAPPPKEEAARGDWLRAAFTTAASHMREAAVAPCVARRPAPDLSHGRMIDAPSLVWSGGGASIAIAVLVGRSLLIAHAGDVRATLRRAHPRDGRWSSKDFEPLTTDDALLPEGAPLPEGWTESLRDVVTRALGFDDQPSAIVQRELEPGDVVLLASHGLYRALDRELREAILMRRAPEHWPLLLLEEARVREAGNVTALVGIAQ
jgi:serine/threonine protein phosphatase PrpC